MNNNSTKTNITLNSPQSCSTLIQSSRVCKPVVYNGETNENANLWLNAMQRFLKLNNLPEHLWVATAASYLKANAQLWWDSWLNSCPLSENEVMIDDFKTTFYEVPTD